MSGHIVECSGSHNGSVECESEGQVARVLLFSLREEVAVGVVLHCLGDVSEVMFHYY